MNQKYALKIEQLTFKFHNQSNYFFHNISLRFEANQLHFIQGKNGSGKSTFFRILQGKIYDNERLEGTLYVNNQKYAISNSQFNNKKLTQYIKMVQQKFDTMIADQFTFEQNLQLAQLATYPGLKTLPTNNPFEHILKQFAIDKKKPAHLLSGGQRQILTILMVLQKPTHILLLDEPTAALDEKNAQIVLQFLTFLSQSMGLTILIISHDKELIKTYAQSKYIEIQEHEHGIRTIQKVSL